jgi:outer membrane immunogenic protein
MPVKAAPRVVPVASDWTGFYIFGFGGYSWGRISPEERDFVATGFPHNPKPKGGVFGFGGGYNWQYGGWIGGVEVDYGFSNEKETLRFSETGRCGDGCTVTDTTTLHSKIDALGSARLRVGYLIMPSVLAYGTAGAGWGRAELSFANTHCINISECDRSSLVAKPNLFGWVAGGGLEFKVLEHVRLRGEYLHYDFGSTGYSLEAAGNFKPDTLNAKTRDDVVRGALIWNF